MRHSLYIQNKNCTFAQIIMILFKNIYILQTKYSILIILFFVLFTVQNPIYAQGILTHRWNTDSTVTFTYIDSTARSVAIESSCLLPYEDHSFAGRQARRAMQAIQPSVWQLTTRRTIKPELYTFRLFVNGKQQKQLPHYESIWKRNKQMHILLLADSPQSQLYAATHPQGRLDTIDFRGEKGNMFHAVVYLPVGYNDTTEYPVFYLFHGINGNQYDWLGQGRIANILDHLIAQQQIQPLVVVMPYCLLSESKFQDHVKATNVGNYGEILSGKFERQFYEIHRYIQSHYSIRPTGNAIAGLSCGARQAVNIAHADSSTFAYVGLFSPVVSYRQLPKAYTNTLYWVGACSDDWMFRDEAKRFVRGLRKQQIQPIYIETIGGHTFTNWRIFATEFLQWAYPTEIINNK